MLTAIDRHADRARVSDHRIAVYVLFIRSLYCCSFVETTLTRRTSLASQIHSLSFPAAMKMEREFCWHFLSISINPEFYKNMQRIRFSLVMSWWIILNRYTICHKTEVVKNTLNPVWQAFKIPVRALCNGDYDRWVLSYIYAAQLALFHVQTWRILYCRTNAIMLYFWCIFCTTTMS